MHPRTYRPLAGIGLALATMIGSAHAAEPITILMNTSPWYASFEAVVQKYEADTGNKVTIDQVPLSGLLAKTRNSLRSGTAEHDLINLNNAWVVEIYEDGYLTPLTDIDSAFVMSDDFIDAGLAYWNADKRWPTKDGGKLMAFIPNPNVAMWFYRNDLMDKVPETWDEVIEVCKRIQNRPTTYGAIMPGERGNSIRYHFMNFMFGYKGSIEKDPENGDFTVTFNSPQNKQALDMFLAVARECSSDNAGALTGGDVAQMMATGKALQSSQSIGSQAQMEDPTKSVVVGKVGYGVMPRGADGVHGPIWGSWQMGVPKSIPDARKQAAMEFIKWFLTEETQTFYAEKGGIPVSHTVLNGPLSEKPENRWMKPFSESAKVARQALTYKEGAEVNDIIGLRLNQALIGEISSSEALNLAAKEIHDVFVRSGRKTGVLDPLP